MRPTPALMISVTSPFPGTLVLSRTDADRVPPSLLPPVVDHRYQIPQVVIIVIIVLVSAFLLITCYVAFVKHCSSWTQVLNRSNRSPPASDHQRSDELVRNHRGDQNLSVDHPFWLITSVGLQQSVIDSIAVIRFKRGEDLTEGTDCSVCLVEFQEGEHLRLLPRCNHAFHIDCIDTWLSSHTNCPLCRQGVVVSSDGPSLGQNEPRFRQVRWAELPRLEDSDSNSSDVDVGNTQARSPNRADTEHSYEIDNNNNNNNSNNNDKRKVEDGKSIIIMNRERRCFSMDVVDGSNSCNVDYDMSQGDANSSSFGLTASSSSWRSHPAKKRSYSWSEKVH